MSAEGKRDWAGACGSDSSGTSGASRFGNIQPSHHSPRSDIVAKIEIFLPRYYANAVLDSIHKQVAIEQWAKFTRDVVPADLSTRDLNRVIERNQAAFDMFILHDQPGDIDEVGFRCSCVGLQAADLHGSPVPPTLVF